MDAIIVLNMRIAALFLSWRTNVRYWIRNQLIAPILTRIVGWAFSYTQVQNQFVERIHCDTPIGRALNHQIESLTHDVVEDAINDHKGNTSVDADDISGLDSYIESQLEDYFRDNAIRASDIDGLDKEIEEQLSSCLEDAVEEAVGQAIPDDDSHLAKLVAQRMSY